MTLQSDPLRILSDMQNDRDANPDVTLDYGRAYTDTRTTHRDDDVVDDTTLMLFVYQRNRNFAAKYRGRVNDETFAGIDDLRVAVTAAGESWPPRRLWFQGYAAAHGRSF